MELSAIDRTLVAAGAAAAVPPGEVLRVLMVIARPEGVADVSYQNLFVGSIRQLVRCRLQLLVEL